MSDNGASAEGGPEGSINDIRLTNLDPAGTAEMYERLDEIGGPLTHNNYPWGWTMAGNTPFKRWKREVHQGGVADPCIISWPAQLSGSAGAIRHQFVHAIDVLPTVLELVGHRAPGGDRVRAPDPFRRHRLRLPAGTRRGSRPPNGTRPSISRCSARGPSTTEGWKAVTYHPVGPLYDDGLSPNAPFDEDVWELYHVAEDLSETSDLAAEQPERVAEMVELWWHEAERNQVLPLDNRVLWVITNPKPHRRRQRSRFRYFPGGAQVPESVAVNVRNRSHAITVTVEVARRGRPRAVSSWPSARALGGLVAPPARRPAPLRPQPLRQATLRDRVRRRRSGPGRHTLGFRFEKDDERGRGARSLVVDGTVVAEGVIRRFTPAAFNGVGVGLTCGYEWGPAVGDGYDAPFAFNGTITRAVVEATGPVVRDPLAEIAAIMSEQ